MNINLPKDTDDIIILVSPLEYKRLYEIIEDYACEYGTKEDMIFDMLDAMNRFNQ